MGRVKEEVRGASASASSSEEEGEGAWRSVNGVRYRLEMTTDGASTSDDEASAPAQQHLPVPVFYAEEKDTREPFEAFVVKVEPVLEEYGIGKVVPPPGWAPMTAAAKGGSPLRRSGAGKREQDVRAQLRERADKLVIDKPIKQHATGRKGLYRSVLVEQKGMRASAFREMAERARSKYADGKGTFDLAAIERHFWKNVTYQPPMYGADTSGSLFDELGEDGLPPAFSGSAAGAWNIRNLNTILSKFIKAVEEEEERAANTKGSQVSEGCFSERGRGRRDGRPFRSSVSLKRKRKEEAAAEERKQRRAKEGAGVISPFLYFGMYRSFFAWHTEDVDLYSVNYLHFGEPKVWYCVPPSHRKRFESTMQSLVPDLFRACKQFMRHKELMASPLLLKNEAIPLVKFVQRENEWVINYPGAYHAGFNSGYNCAESVNLATRKWIEIGRDAVPCECASDSVRLDMDLFERYANGQPLQQASDSESDDEAKEEDEEEKGVPAVNPAARKVPKRECRLKEEAKEEREEEREPTAAAAAGAGASATPTITAVEDKAVQVDFPPHERLLLIDTEGEAQAQSAGSGRKGTPIRVVPSFNEGKGVVDLCQCL